MLVADLVRNWDYVIGFKEGRVLQYKKDNGTWANTTNPSFGANTVYRFADEVPVAAPAPTYRAYNSEELSQLVGKRLLKGRTILFVSGYDPEEETVLIGANWLNAEELKRQYTLEDGSICGVRNN